MALYPVKGLRDAEVRPGDVIRWGSGARWAIVCETDIGPSGFEARLRWAFGADAGQWVPSESGVIEGWVLLRSNEHALYRRHGGHTAKDRRNARSDAIAVLGQSNVEEWYS